jgi:hypothetical protein
VGALWAHSPRRDGVQGESAMMVITGDDGMDSGEGRWVRRSGGGLGFVMVNTEDNFAIQRK